MQPSKRSSLSFEGSLTPITIVVYLAAFALWRQFVFGPHSFTLLRVIFLVGIVVLLLARGRGGEIKSYFVGRFLPNGSLLLVVFSIALLALTRMAYFAWFSRSPVSSSLFWSDLIEAPLNEEIVFRGIFLSILLQYMKTSWAAISLSVFIFATTHTLDRMSTIISTLVMGTLLGWIYWKFRSVPFCMLCHSLWNLLGDIS
jgi:membrane protease YdiL (CAAX protease family)